MTLAIGMALGRRLAFGSAMAGHGWLEGRPSVALLSNDYNGWLWLAHFLPPPNKTRRNINFNGDQLPMAVQSERADGL